MKYKVTINAPEIQVVEAQSPSLALEKAVEYENRNSWQSQYANYTVEQID